MRYIFFLFINLFVCFSIFSQVRIIQDPYPKFDHITVKNGLSNDNVRDIFQDSQGYLWIATTNGLNRYNAYDIKVFHHNSDDSTTLSSSFITCIAEDSSGKLWFGSKEGLNLFDPVTENFTNHRNTNDSIFTKREVRCLLADENNILWIETVDGKLLKYSSANTQYKIYNHNPPSMVNTYFYHAMLKDPTGMIWLGGRYMGLIRFNPKLESFSTIKTDPESSTKKRDDDAAVYFIDSEGTYWVGGIDGCYSFEPETEIFNKSLSVSTFSIAEDKNNDLWIGTGNGVYLKQKKDNTIRHFSHDDNNRFSLIDNHINKIFIDRSGNVWIGSRRGLNVFRPSKNRFKHIYHIPENKNTPVSNHITAILEDKDQNIWIGTEEKGVEIFDSIFNKVGSYSDQRELPFNLASDKISFLKQDGEGDVWVGQWSGRGFNIVNPTKRSNEHFRLLKSGLMADWYSDFLEDSHGNYWLGAWGASGLYQFDKNKKMVTGERYAIYPYSHLPVKDLHFDGRRIWISSSSQYHILCYDTQLNKYQYYKKDNYHNFDFNKIITISEENGNTTFFTNTGKYILYNNPYPSFNKVDGIDYSKSINNKNFKHLQIPDSIKIYCQYKDSKNNIWIGTSHGLIYKTKNGNTEIFSIRSQIPDFISDSIYDLVFNPPKLIFLGTDAGLVTFNTSTKQFIHLKVNKEDYLSSRLIKFLFEDSEGYIWVGTTDNSLNRFNPATGEFKHYLDDRNNTKGFWGKEASCIAEDKNGNLWIGGYGVNVFNRTTKTFNHITAEKGLSSNNISAILIDKNKVAWISTSNGLNCIDIDSGIISSFYEKDGLQDNNFSNAAYQLTNGKLTFGGQNGLNIFDPEKITLNTSPPPVKISGFKIFEIVQRNLPRSGNPIKLKYNQNYFSFEFTALDFSNPEFNMYAYKLDNMDEDWIYSGAENRIARYTNVDPGEYTFKVKAANSDGIWNENGTAIPIIIRPPFWKTMWFYILEIFIVAALIIYLIKYRENKIKEESRVMALEQKLLRSQMNPHFIFNSLSSIQSFIFENNPLQAGSYLSRFAELVRSILYNSREEYVPLDKEIKTLQNYFDLQQLRFNNSFDYIIDADPLMDPETILVPPMLAQPFIENAIEHGIKYVEQNAFISISFTQMKNTLLMIIEDNGIGIQAAKKQNRIKAKEHKSLATTITRERIEIFNKGNKRKPFSMDISDLKDKNDKIAGTRVKLIIPFVQT